MKQITIQAQDVRVGDRIWFGDWKPVVAIERSSTDNFVDLVVYQDNNRKIYTIKHRREGIAVQREEA